MQGRTGTYSIFDSQRLYVLAPETVSSSESFFFFLDSIPDIIQANSSLLVERLDSIGSRLNAERGLVFIWTFPNMDTSDNRGGAIRLKCRILTPRHLAGR
jgi:hypothetical protein